MFNNLMQFNVLVKLLANTLLVSIPEETFIVVFVLSFLGMFEFLRPENWEENRKELIRSTIKKALIPIVVTAFISNIMRYSGVDFVISYILFLVVLYTTMLGVFGLWKNIKDVAKTLLFVLFAGAIIIIVESAYIPLILYSMNVTVSEVNNSIVYNFLICLPERVIESFIIVHLLTKKCTFLKAKLLKPILESKLLLSITICLTMFNIGIMVLLSKIIGYDKVIAKLPYLTQTIVIVGSFLIPLLNISGYIWSIYHKENQKWERNEWLIKHVNKNVQEIKAACKSKEDIKLDQLFSILDSIKVEVEDLRQNY